MKTTTNEADLNEKVSVGNGTYTLPGELAIAIMTSRHQLVRPLVRQVRAGEVTLSPELVSEVLRLCADLIQDREEKEDEIDRLEAAISVFELGLKDLDQKVTDILTDARHARE